MKFCKKCNTLKAEEDFNKNRSRPGGLHYECRECARITRAKQHQKNPEKQAEYAKRCWEKKGPGSRAVYLKNWHSINPGKQAQYARKCVHGLTVEEYSRMFTEQCGACAICRKVKKLVVDHDHETGVVRALLCSNCNAALGMVKESLEIVSRLRLYLKKHL